MPSKSTLAFLLAQLLAAGAVVYLYEIEGSTFFQLFVLATAGFIVNLALPQAWRMAFFALLSLAGVFIVFDPADGLWLIGSSLVLIGLCHLPLPIAGRLLLIVAVGAALAAGRAGLFAVPWSAFVWPVLGSMFMFRLFIYVLAVKDDAPKGRFWATLGYFFMFPNLVFPLFPVIDYQQFRRTHYDKDALAIYQQGIMWIVRGLLHLILYRLVYHRFLIDPIDVQRLGDLTQAMLATFLLYLRVSGSFHLIIGLLHLFGFRLPETHKLYYLAHSFTELWRRINIYWKDFMMSSVFYPLYFRVKQWGPAKALAFATAGVFVMTWLLHSYQWFWLRGGFPVTAPDILFWGLLGGMVIYGALRELKPGSAARRQAPGWSLAAGLRAFRTFAILCVLWSLWSAESVGQWLWMIGAAGEVDRKGVILIAAIFAVVVLLGGRNWEAPATGPGWWQFAQRPAVRTCATLALLFALLHPAMQRIAPAGVPDPLAALRAVGLNDNDARLKHRGYYEELDVRGQLAAAMIVGPDGQRRENWEKLESTGILRMREDPVAWDLWPSKSLTFHGKPLSTNRWGMRDIDYEREKPPGTFRVALLGASVAMGNGVGDGEAFETLVEKRLNDERPLGDGTRFEVLNFAVDAQGIVQQVALMDDRVFGFAPDVVIITNYSYEPDMSERYLRRIASLGIALPEAEPRDLLARENVADAKRGALPIPYESLRALARSLGLDPRMPYPELQSRIHRIAPDVTRWAIGHFAEQVRSRGARPVVILLDAVHKREEQSVSHLPDFGRAGVPVINLMDVYPESRHDALRAAPWDDHPNAAGHQLIADGLYPELLRIIREEPARP